MVKRGDLQYIGKLPEGLRLKMVRSWDYAATDPAKNPNYNDPDWTVGVKMGIDMAGGKDPDVYIVDVIRDRLDPGPRDELVDSTAAMDTRTTTVWIEQEPGASGKSIIYEARKRLSGYAVNPPRLDPLPSTPRTAKTRSKEAGVPTGNKVQRAEGFATHCHRGKVYILQGEWNAAYVQEITTFPLSAKKDQMDATSQGFLRLMERPPSTAELMAMRGHGR